MIGSSCELIRWVDRYPLTEVNRADIKAAETFSSVFLICIFGPQVKHRREENLGEPTAVSEHFQLPFPTLQRPWRRFMKTGSEENEEERHGGVETSKRKWEKEWNKYTKQRRRWR